MNTGDIINCINKNNFITEAAIAFTFDMIKPHPIYEEIRFNIDYKYFQVYWEPKNQSKNEPPYTNVLNILYNGIPLVEYYLDEDWPNKDELDELLSMDLEEKRKYFFDNYKDIIFDDSYAADIVINNEPTILKSDQEFLNAIYWD